MALSKVTPGSRVKLKAELLNTVVDLDAAASAGHAGRFDDKEPHDWEELIITGILTTVTADQKFKYKVKRVFDAHSSTDWTAAEIEPSGVEFEARNTWENGSRVGVKAGYSSGSVTGLKPIPTGAHIIGRRIEIDGALFYRFSERNEPIC